MYFENKFNIITSTEHQLILKERIRSIHSGTAEINQYIKPITLEYDVDTISFNVFGCWNSISSSTFLGSDSLDSFKRTKSLPVLSDMIQKFENVLKPSFTIITGDNFYSENDPNVKTNIDKGFDILTSKASDIPYFLLLGNHDVETRDILFTEIKKTFDDVIFKNSSTFFGKWILPGINYLIKIKSPLASCCFLMVDTNIFVEKMYAQARLSKNTIQSMLLEWIDSTLSSIRDTPSQGPVFVVGHHPIYAFGHKTSRPIIYNNELDELYALLIKHNVKFYLCADEHNFQYIYDNNNDIHHILSGGSSSGDESFTYVHEAYGEEEIPFDSRGIKLNIPETQLYGKMLINSPHFVNISVDASKIDVRIVSLSLNQYHSINHLKNKCYSTKKHSLESLRGHYDIVYSFTVAKYNDYIFILDCDRYIKRLESELEDIKKKNKKFIGGYNTNIALNTIQYKLNWNKIENVIQI